MMSKLSLAVAATLLTGVALAAAPQHPDFTGVWTNAGAPAMGGTTNTAANVVLPMLPGPKARVDAYNKLVQPLGETPGGWCLGTGLPGSMLGSGGYPMEILQREEQINIVYEAHNEARRVYFGARNAPQEDRVPGRNGYSSGHWEGDTLVVETDNLVEQIDQRFAHSDEAKVVERYHLEPKLDDKGRRVLVADMTLTDPKFYSAPVTAQKRWAQVPNGRLLPYECAEEGWNARLAEIAKKAGVALP